MVKRIKRQSSGLSRLKKTRPLPPQLAGLLQEAEALVRNRLVEQAMLCYRQALALAPDREEIYLKFGELLERLGRLPDLVELYQAALAVGVNTVRICNLLGQALSESGRHQEALAVLEKTALLYPADGVSISNLATVFQELGRVEDALDAYRRAARLLPGYAQLFFQQGQCLAHLGRSVESESSLRQALRLDPGNTEAHLLLTELKKFQDRADQDIQTMTNLLQTGTLAWRGRQNLCFALGKSYEDLRDYDRAFQYYSAGNRLHREVNPFSSAANEHLISKLIDLFSGKFLADHENCEARGPIRPLFVLGMPRSGTSLIEQILASHPLVYGGGELVWLSRILSNATGPLETPQFSSRLSALTPPQLMELGRAYLDQLAALPGRGERPFVTDKMPHNFLLIGLIKVLFPEARVVHCRRHPMDNCWSIYKNLFKSGHSYAYDLAELGDYYVQYAKLMEHWHRLLPGFIYDISYEALVDDTENEARNLLGFCGLDWDERCLEFHRSKRAVRTLSAIQVRQPIYRDSIRLWKRYGDKLAPLAQALEKAPGTDQNFMVQA